VCIVNLFTTLCEVSIHTRLCLKQIFNVCTVTCRQFPEPVIRLLTFAPRKTYRRLPACSNLTLHSYHATARIMIPHIHLDCKHFFEEFYKIFYVISVKMPNTQNIVYGTLDFGCFFYNINIYSNKVFRILYFVHLPEAPHGSTSPLLLTGRPISSAST